MAGVTGVGFLLRWEQATLGVGRTLTRAGVLSDPGGIIVSMLQVCLNGVRRRDECRHVPLSADELAAAAVDAVAAGAEDIHLHPKDPDGADTLEPEYVARTVAAVRAAVPGVPVGVTTGAWAAPDPGRRAALVRSWTVLPDHASVNWHEDGAGLVVEALLDRGVGIEAGIYSGTQAARTFLGRPSAHRVRRILAEVVERDPRAALIAARQLLDELSTAGSPILLHGEDAAAWPLVRLAGALRLDTRIGFEDVLALPDGSPATSNAELVLAARDA